MTWGTSSLNPGGKALATVRQAVAAYGVSVDTQFASDRSEGDSPEHSLTESSASSGYFVLLLLGLAGPQVPLHIASLQYREKLAKPPPAGGPLPAGDGSVGVARDGFRYGAVSSESRPLSVLDLGCIRVIPTPQETALVTPTT